LLLLLLLLLLLPVSQRGNRVDWPADAVPAAVPEGMPAVGEWMSLELHGLPCMEADGRTDAEPNAGIPPAGTLKRLSGKGATLAGDGGGLARLGATAALPRVPATGVDP
jgi:hypothetical protein